MNPFLISETRLADLTATRQGRVSLAGFNYQAAYAVARIASMLIRRPLLDLPDFPLRLRYDWGEDLDERCEDGRVVFTQCKRIANIGQPAGLASVMQSFAGKWLSAPDAERSKVYFRLVCTDTRFRAGGPLRNIAVDARTDTGKHLESELSTKPHDKSDRALWQAEADAFGHAPLFAALWERTDVLFLPPNAIDGLPASPLLHAEREALENLLTFSQIQTSKQAEALDRLRRIVHDNLITFDPANETEMDYPHRSPRIRERADVANALASCQPTAGGSLPFQVVDRTFLGKQREASRRQFVARQPDWADVVHGADETIKFVERTITAEMRDKILTELVDPLERGTDLKLHMLFVVGAPGSGKTTLVRRIAAMLVDEGRIVVADAGVGVYEPAGSPEDYAAPLEQLANAGRPVIFLLDDPLYGDSPWIPVLKRLNRPGLNVAALSPCPQMWFDLHRGTIRFGDVKHFSIGSPTEEERLAMCRLYNREMDALMNADEFLVITMQAAAGIRFEEIIDRLWQTLNNGNTPDNWNATAWTFRAFLIVAFFDRAYSGCPEPILRAALASNSIGQPTSISGELARLESQDGWLMFKFRKPDRPNYEYQGVLIHTAHQRIAQRAWELRPIDWVDVGSNIVEASLLASASIRHVGALAARLLGADNEADKNFARRLVDAWCREEHQSKLETRRLCELVTSFQTNGQRQIAVRLKPILMKRAQLPNDGWIAALQLCFLSGDTQAEQFYPAELDLPTIISQADFSIAPNRATHFLSRLPCQTKPAFTKRMLDAFDGALTWGLDSFLIGWLLRNAAFEEILKRSEEIEKWLKGNEYDTNVRNGYLGLLSKHDLEKAQLDRVIADTEQWLKDHEDDSHVRAAFLGFLESKPECEGRLRAAMREVKEWLITHPKDIYTRQRYVALQKLQHLLYPCPAIKSSILEQPRPSTNSSILDDMEFKWPTE